MGQDDVIKALLEVNPNTTIVLIAGSPVEMPWLPRAASLIQTSYCGMMGGIALANILFGETNPSGKLPETYPLHPEDCPVHQEEETATDTKSSYRGIRTEKGHPIVHYTEGIFVGYRYYLTNRKPVAFPFGHGLSYSEFRYDGLQVLKQESVSGEDFRIIIRFTLQNTGRRSGKEVVQLYIGEKEPSVPRPLRELKAFRKIYIESGLSKDVSFTLTKKDLAFFDEEHSAFHVNSGKYTVYVGSSSMDIHLEQTFELASEYTGIDSI